MKKDPTNPDDGGEDAWADDAADDYEADDANERDVGDENEDADDDPYLDPWDAGVDPDAKAAVERWRIVAVGRRPEGFLARDCLYGSLLRDHRVPWFRRYLKRPDDWMEALAAHLPKKSDRRQALQCVVLDYLHKLHLARLYPVLVHEYGDGDETDLFRRLWRCTPYTVQVERRSGGKKNVPRGCGYPRLCPWCFARRVVQLHAVIRNGPLKEPAGKHLLLGKPDAFAEAFGGIDGTWQHADWVAYTQGESVRGHFSRYYGRNPGRAAETKRVLANTLLAAANNLGAAGGLLTHQIGSAQLASGQRTFLHDLGVIAELNAEAAADLMRLAGGSAYWQSVEPLEAAKGHALNMRWLLLPANRPSSLRVAMAGGSVSHLQRHLGSHKDDGAHTGYIRGAFSWQPTLLLDDEMWFPYIHEVRGQRLYVAFGSWRDGMTAAAADARRSIDYKFKQAQSARHAHKKQQAGNRQRRHKVEDRRADLLAVARGLWVQVVTDVAASPPHMTLRAEMPECSWQESFLNSLTRNAQAIMSFGRNRVSPAKAKIELTLVVFSLLMKALIAVPITVVPASIWLTVVYCGSNSLLNAVELGLFCELAMGQPGLVDIRA